MIIPQDFVFFKNQTNCPVIHFSLCQTFINRYSSQGSFGRVDDLITLKKLL